MKKTMLFGLTLAVVLGGLSGAAVAQLASSPWPMFHHDARHTGRSSLPGPSNGLTDKWPTPYTGVDWIKTQTSVGPDGHVYLAHGKNVVCKVRESDGAEIWCSGLGGFANTSTPALGNGTSSTNFKVYRGERNNRFWSIDSPSGFATLPHRDCIDVDCPDADIAWMFPGWPYKMPWDGDVFSSTAIAEDGAVYTACGCLSNGLLHAFRPDGSQWWEPFKVGKTGIRNSSPAVVRIVKGSAPTPPAGLPSGATYTHTNVVYIGGVNGYLHRIDDDVWSDSAGKRVAARPTAAWAEGRRVGTATSNLNSSPSVDAAGNIYIGTNKGVGSFLPDGTMRPGWPVLVTAGVVDTTAAIGTDGRIYVSVFKTGVRTLYALNASTGATVWQSIPANSTAIVGFAQSPSPVIDSSGNVYAGFSDTVKKFNASTGAVLGFRQLDPNKTGDDVITMSLGSGVLYVSSRNKKLYALE